MTVWMKHSTVHCKLENRNQEEKFYREILFADKPNLFCLQVQRNEIFQF